MDIKVTKPACVNKKRNFSKIESRPTVNMN